MIAAAITPFWAGMLLLFARLTGVVFAAPLLSDAAVPTGVRVGLAMALTAALAGFARAEVASLSLPALLFHLALELALGLGMGFLASAMLYAALTWGGWADAASGLSIATLFNPLYLGSTSLFQGATGTLALFVYAASGGLDALVVTLAAGVRLVPVGFHAFPSPSLLGVSLALVSGLFGTAALLALPLLVALALVNFAIGLLARMLPQMNVFALSLGVGPALAVVLLALGVGSAAGVLSQYEASALNLLLGFLHTLR
jgi:flagellar biosynthetic protein FliR